MSTKETKMAKNKKGNDKVEYPKLVMYEGKKVRVLSKDEEDKLGKPAKAWGNKEAKD